jgi:hypothetical protein
MRSNARPYEHRRPPRGAGDVSLTDCAAVPASHIGCVPSFLAIMLGEFALRARDL